MIYEKWRELNIDPSKIKYKNIIVEKIISYPPAGNDVVECIAEVNDKKENVFIKIERSKVCDFESEVKHLNYLLDNNYYTKLPKVYENGSFDGKNYIVLSTKTNKFQCFAPMKRLFYPQLMAILPRFKL